MNKTQITAEKLESDLAEYTGTEHYFYLPTFGDKSLQYTDGIRAMAERAGAYWLLDEINAATIEHFEFRAGFWMVKMESAKSEGKIEIAFDFDEDGTPIDQHGTRGLADFEKEIPFTDFPEGKFIFYIENGIILLRSEY